jgi:predicted short-subunit dehydrogenase-like oxidoreductase (DUF2520 family)
MLAPVKQPVVAILGRGRLGSALAKRLAAAGYSVRKIPSRPQAHARARPLIGQSRTRPEEGALLDSDIVWFCVPDAQIRKSASRLAGRSWRGKVALHSSGALGASALDCLARQGATVASVHPLMTFVKGAIPELRGVPFAIEGEPRAAGVASHIARDLGGEVFRIKAEDKAAYHAFATMVCPFLVALVVSAEAVAALAGISARSSRRRMMPIIRQTLANYEKLGPARSFSGPIARGDLETIRSHLEALSRVPAAKHVYLALAQAAFEYLPRAKAGKLAALLKQASQGTAGRNRKGTNRARRHSTHRT